VPRFREFKWNSWARWARDEIMRDAPEVIAVDTETSGVAFYDEPFAATLTWRGVDGALRNAYFELASPLDGGVDHNLLTRELLQQILRHVPTWVMHNAKFDLQKLLLVGAITWDDVREHRIEDTQTMAHLLNENRPKALKKLAVSVLGWDDTVEVEIKSGPNKGQKRRVPREEHHLAAVRRKLKLKKEDGYHLLPREALVPYALRDTDFTLLLYEELRPQLERQDADLQNLYEREMQLKLVLLRMIERGMGVDCEYLREKTSEYGVRVMRAWQRVVDLTGNADLNPQSPKQLIEAFAKRGVVLESTAEHVLRELDDDLARAIIEYRSDKKMHTTYLVALLAEQRDGVVHPWFNEDGARTGRMSSSSAKE
jgi:DNA polymerase I-like protein with 3'-5' exonuclease and polymerase domains